MNTLILLSGIGIWALASSILFIIILGVVTRSSKDAKKQHSITEDLMRERNDLDREKVEILRQILISLK